MRLCSLRMANKMGSVFFDVGILQWKQNNLFMCVRVCVCVCFYELNVTVKYIEIQSIAQQCFYRKFMSQTTMQITCTSL
jgi:hypothetical protein